MGRWIREPFNGLSHGIGAILSLIGLIVLLVLAQGRVWHTVGFAIYGVSLIVLYTGSCLYHSLKLAPKHITRLQRLDHSAIFLLIAGTYAPVCLVTLHGTTWGWSLLTAQYVLAAIGITSVILFKSKPEWLRVVIYLGMGWMALLAMVPLRAVFSSTAMAWLVGGGVIYTLGTVIYATNRPRLWPGRFGAHELWHVFVLGGSACHFVLMCYFVA